MATIIYSDINGLNNYASPATLKNLDSIYQKFINLFSTSKGERLDLPDFGASPDPWVFELIDSTTALSIFQNLISETEKWIPMAYIDLQNSEVTPDEDNNSYNKRS